MLKTVCLHPAILHALSKCGHGDKVLIADGNYPIDSNTGPNTEKVYLNLTHGIPLVTDVLKVLNQMIEIEKLEVMMPDDESQPAIFPEFEEAVQSVDHLDGIGRFEFYEACQKKMLNLRLQQVNKDYLPMF